MGKEAYLHSALPISNLAGTCYPNVSGLIFEWHKVLISDYIKEPQWKGNCQVLQTCRAQKPSLYGIL